MREQPLPRTLLQCYNLHPKKGLGQHFLVDTRIAERIVEAAAISAQDTVLEIGPGVGILTGRLAEQARQVIAVELDNALCRVIEKELGDYSNLVVIQGDILQVNWAELAQTYGATSLRVVSNLPYQITSPVLDQLLGYHQWVERAVFMVQQEMAERIAARPGKKTYGILSVLIQYRCRVTRLLRVAADCFFPPPKVASAVLGLDVLANPKAQVEDQTVFMETVRAAFRQRRKMLKNSLLAGLQPTVSKQTLEAAGRYAAIDLTRRAETLTVAEFARLSNALRAK